MAKVIHILKADVFETLMHSKMKYFIEKKKLLSPSKYGFHKLHSTQHAILDIVNTFQTNMDKRLFMWSLFDLKKAFDTVVLNIIHKKLGHYGFRDAINK